MVRWSAVVAVLLILTGPAWAKREHIVYFQGTDYELEIFKIYGQRPGKTLMLIGGIQGNEPGGFLSADLYADMALEKGNLIVIPRANFYSILLNQRGPNGDMNRKFNKPGEADQELQIVAILKELMAESDCLLNLHDGSGFFRPTYVSPKMNPRCFGQSIIADTDVFSQPKTERIIPLGDMAQQVCNEINQAIDNPLYHFHFNNHRTAEPGSPNAEQRGSATFYALMRCHIPAFGIETSKDLPTIELKVRHHNLAINSFMRLLDIVPENPAVRLKRPDLRYLIVSVNDGQPLVVPNKSTLNIKRGDRLFISHIEANYERGLSVDILGLGGVNDTRQPFAIMRSTSVIVRKDHQQCGWIRLHAEVGQTKAAAINEPPAAEANPVIQYFVIQVNDEQRLVANGQTLNLVRGDHLSLLESWTSRGEKGRFALNFKGFVVDKKNNDGDDRGVAIPTDDGLMEKWSLEGQGKRYRVVAERGKRDFGEFYVHLAEPSLDYLIVQTRGPSKYAVAPGETLLLNPQDTIQVIDVKANFDTRQGLKFILTHPSGTINLGLRQWLSCREILTPGKRGAKPPELSVWRHNTRVGCIFLVPRSYSAGSEEPGRAS